MGGQGSRERPVTQRIRGPTVRQSSQSSESAPSFTPTFTPNVDFASIKNQPTNTQDPEFDVGQAIIIHPQPPLSTGLENALSFRSRAPQRFSPVSVPSRRNLTYSSLPSFKRELPQTIAQPSFVECMYPPLSLPFSNRNQLATSLHELLSTSPGASNQQLTNTLGSFSDRFSDGSDDPRFVLVQLPLYLPGLEIDTMSKGISTSSTNKEKTTHKKERSSFKSKPYAPCKLTELPEGKFATFIWRKSGRQQLRVGNLLFDVQEGCNPSFNQDAAAFIKDTQELMILGKCSHRLVVTPSLTF